MNRQIPWRGWAALVAACACTLAFAQAPKRVEKADDLPRFTYSMQGGVEATVRDPQKFAAFAQQRRKDVEGMLAAYDITEKATHRSLLGELVTFDMLDGRWDDALRHSNQIRELQEQPAAKLLSGLSTRAIVGAVKKTGSRSGEAFNAEVARAMAAELEAMPYLTVRNEIQQGKAGMQTISEALVMGRVRNVLEPVAAKTGALGSDMAPALGSARYSLQFTLPMKDVYAKVYTDYLHAHKVDKPDIWKARDVALPEGRPYAIVPVVIWDSGVDMPLFKGRELKMGDAPAQIAFDLYNNPSSSPLKPIPEAVRPKLNSLMDNAKGLSDLQSDIDSPEADAVKKLLSTLAPDQYKATIEQLRLTSVYSHGTHVAGIAMAGNPYARVGNARIEFGHTLLPDPCPTDELQQRAADNFAKYADFIRKSGARVVNMSWGGDLKSYEVELEQCGIGKDVAERKVIARKYFDLHYKALVAAFKSLPDVLLVTSAGNSANDPTFNDSYPSSIVLPNLVTVGAVDKAGDEASFTSYGPTVFLHANGYQVESFVPGGRRIAFSGTSMSSPQVTNLAAKMLAVKPSLKPAEVIDIMRKTADRSDDGRRTLLNPKKALAAVGFQP